MCFILLMQPIEYICVCFMLDKYRKILQIDSNSAE